MSTYSQKLSVVEKVGYSLGDLAANLVFQTLVTYLAYFYTDIYGLESNHASAMMLVVGLIAAFGFNPIVGAIADRTQSKWGKFRPWILYTSIPLGVIAILAFSTPDFSYKGKVIYAVVTYTLLLLLYAANNLPYSALSGVITGDMKDRNSLSAYRFVAVMFAQFFCSGIYVADYRIRWKWRQSGRYRKCYDLVGYHWYCYAFNHFFHHKRENRTHTCTKIELEGRLNGLGQKQTMGHHAFADYLSVYQFGDERWFVCLLF